MTQRCSGGNRQLDLFARSKRPTISLPDNHPMVVLTDAVDWTELEARAQQIRTKKLKNGAGRPPHLRATLGALVLMAIRYRPYREVEDQIRYYAPARYLCGLTETDWTPDHTTLHDFAVLLGEDGVALINEYAVHWAVREKLADPTVVVADTTAQEAAIGHPNEMGLMAGFVSSVVLASRRAGRALRAFAQRAEEAVGAARKKLWGYRLNAKDKCKAAKDAMCEQMAKLVGGLNRGLGQALNAARHGGERLRKYGKVARAKLTQLHQTMKRLLPQIRSWLKTGFVAPGKIINLHIPQVYAIVRGKVGKAVEFGVNWGLTQLRGGYVLARRAVDRKELVDTRFAVQAVTDHMARFGRAPRAFAYDRGGYSGRNVRTLRKLGVSDVGLAPRGRAAAPVDNQTARRLGKERALIEGSIGAVKSSRYNFNRPRARSVAMMGTCGQLAVLGFNLNKLARGLAAKRELRLAGVRYQDILDSFGIRTSLTVRRRFLGYALDGAAEDEPEDRVH
jgi:hypothetical protein